MTNRGRLGVCYYPEHWPEAVWRDDAEKMKALGLQQVRIGEFAWSRIEPQPGRFAWEWLDRAIETLAAAGLGVILGTPTATPPKWLIDAHPDILSVDKHGAPRRFGSRRHYCFSSRRYREESARIVEAMAKRYGANEAVIAWQTDNEYGCHDTARSYSPEAERAFRIWLQDRYVEVTALNKAWGTVFWSQEYRSFEEIDLPHLTVTEPNPSHLLDFYRFSSDQVISYNRLQTDILRRCSPGRDIVHNAMGFFFDFDHFKLGDDLDAIGWDSYPLGFLDVAPFPEPDKQRYMRQGHPDFAAFFHDLYRACGKGRWQVLEQQPGPVNWAPHNAAPLSGMVRLWTHEAFAHGAEAVNYFRWRQAPFAQEQMHAGLERPDHTPATAYDEAQTTAKEIATISNDAQHSSARVALLFSYDAHWLFEAQPQGAQWAYSALAYEWYAALRRLGVDIDFISADHPLDGYDFILAPSLPIINETIIERIKRSSAQFLFGPRSGSKTESLTIPDNLAPGLLEELIPIKVSHCESFPPYHQEEGKFGDTQVAGRAWLDHIETAMEPIAQTNAGAGLYYEHDRIAYLATVPDHMFLGVVFMRLLEKAGVPAQLLHEDLRIRRNGDVCYAFNYGLEPVPLPAHLGPADGSFFLGGPTLPPAGVSAWRASSNNNQDPS